MSRNSCRNCRRNQRNVQVPGAVSTSPQRKETISQKHDVAKPSSLNATTTIANLKVLCAQVVAEERDTAISKAEPTKPNQVTAEDSGVKASFVSNKGQTPVVSEVTADSHGQGSVHKSPLVTETLFYDFMDEIDNLSGKPQLTTKSADPNISRCQGDDRNSRTGRQLWTRDTSQSAEFLDTKRQMRYIGDLDLQQSVRRTEHVSSPLSRKARTKVENRAPSALTKSCVGTHLPRPQTRRRQSSKVSTASARSAKRKTNEMLSREFEQTAHLGDIALESPEISP